MPYKDPQARKDRAKWRRAQAKGQTVPPPTSPRNILDSLPGAKAVRVGVIEDDSPAVIAAPLHDSAGSVPEAGSEGSGLGVDTPPQNPEDVVELDPKTMVALTKGAFAIVSLVTRHDHWKVDDEEIEPIAEPMCRQAMRIPVIAALGQNTADLILIGSTLGTLIFLRVQQSQELARREAEARRPREIRRGGETYRVPEAEGGDRHQEVREPMDPHDKPNLEMFRAAR